MTQAVQDALSTMPAGHTKGVCSPSSTWARGQAKGWAWVMQAAMSRSKHR